MKAKKITIEFEGREPLEIVLKDFEALNFSQTNGMFDGWDEKTDSIQKMPNGKRYITIRIAPAAETD